MDFVQFQREQIQKECDHKVLNIQKNNYSLRKNFLKENQLLRETYFMLNKNMMDSETARMHANTHFFKVEEGLDEEICELLN